jgi:hypothetical protein
MRRESCGEAHCKHGCDCHRDQVNSPGMVAFTYKVDVSGAAFVSIYVNVHSSGLRRPLANAEYHLLRMAVHS